MNRSPAEKHPDSEFVESHQIVTDNANGLIAVRSESREHQRASSIWAEVILIEKKSGKFRKLSASASGDVVKDLRGTCRSTE